MGHALSSLNAVRYFSSFSVSHQICHPKECFDFAAGGKCKWVPQHANKLEGVDSLVYLLGRCSVLSRSLSFRSFTPIKPTNSRSDEILNAKARVTTTCDTLLLSFLANWIVMCTLRKMHPPASPDYKLNSSVPQKIL